MPRYAYTIGMSARWGVELILAGAIQFTGHQVSEVLNSVAFDLKNGVDPFRRPFPIDSLGSFWLRRVDASWQDLLMLGAIDFFGGSSFCALQVVPDSEHWTIDVPDLERPWSPTAEPVWKWLRVPWEFRVAAHSTATTNLDALRGAAVTEAVRWEEDQWELFAGAGPETPEGDIRVAPLGTLLAVDPSLTPVVDLTVGQGIWRDGRREPWHAWG